MGRKKKVKVTLICKKCKGEFTVLPYKAKTQKYCSYVCSNNRIRTCDELNKISASSKQRFIDNPKLREICSENGKRSMANIIKTGKQWRMPIGHHTDDFKEKVSERMKSIKRTDEWNANIKKSHWAYSDQRDAIIEKINKSKQESDLWNAPDRINQLANWSLEHPDKVGPKFYKRGGYKNKKTGMLEYYASGFELKWMKIFDDDATIVFWTKAHRIKIPYVYKNKSRMYIPDFLVEYETGVMELVETKGRVYDQGMIDEKNKAAIEYSRENKLQYKMIYQ